MRKKESLKPILLIVLLSWTVEAYGSDNAKALFETNCAACHGVTGEGDGPAAVAIKSPKPRNFKSEDFKYGSSDDELIKTISSGVPGTAMPPWGHMPKEDILAIVNYIKKFKIPKK